MSDEKQHVAVVVGLHRMRRALEVTIVQSPTIAYRSTALNYLRLTDDLLRAVVRDDDWLGKASEEVPHFSELTAEVQSAANAQVWAQVLGGCYTAFEALPGTAFAFKALPGEPGWKPIKLQPPP